MIVTATVLPNWAWPPKWIAEKLSAVSTERITLCMVILFGALLLAGMAAFAPVWLAISLVLLAVALVGLACWPAIVRLWRLTSRH